MRTSVDTRLVFLAENLTQAWNLNLQDDPNVEVLRGSLPAKLMRLLNLIGKREVELVNLAGWGHPLLFAAMLVAAIYRIPITIESDTQFEPTKSAWRRAIKRLIFPTLFRIPRLFLPAGTRQKNYFMRYGVDQRQIRVAQMSVDVCSIMAQVDMYRAKSTHDLSKKQFVVFLYVGRLELYKGIHDLLKAFVDLNRDGDSARLIIVGDGSLREFVQSSASTNSNITYLGRLSGEELFNVYSQANVFVLPSRVEPWGLVINEAMAASLPVIATDRVGCIEDLLRQGENGYVVPSSNPNSLAEAMRNFIRRPDLAETMGQKSRQLIADWTIEDEAKIMLAAWSEVT